MKFLTLLIVLFLSFAAQATPEFSKILSKYTSATNVEVNLKKTDEKMTLGTKSVSEGTLKFAKDKIYILLNGDKKIEFFYNNNSIWLVEYPDLDFDKDGKRKVTILL